ncbi:hypothetical protein IE53DRAFT_72641 [Violaceomyces palustris]|uniref:Uncharacterized protein n=1 Tax=Violaceomyces palustris TaxID=1673888 RepID=A0ACD0NYT4_9BASI|nr:hypothetical protein IE53DRAFT_72641 [Violaceomyces palustris]
MNTGGGLPPKGSFPLWIEEGRIVGRGEIAVPPCWASKQRWRWRRIRLNDVEFLCPFRLPYFLFSFLCSLFLLFFYFSVHLSNKGSRHLCGK